jgi:hypothetical protein
MGLAWRTLRNLFASFSVKDLDRKVRKGDRKESKGNEIIRERDLIHL